MEISRLMQINIQKWIFAQQLIQVTIYNRNIKYYGYCKSLFHFIFMCI